MNEWIYQGAILTDTTIPAKAYGFLYIITHTPTGKRYLGRKYITKAKTKTVKGKKIKSRVESDWRDYWGSSPYLLDWIAVEGKENFTREIILWSEGRGEINWLEVEMQVKLNVLRDDSWMNSNISAKYYKKNIQKYQKIDNLVQELSTEKKGA